MEQGQGRPLVGVALAIALSAALLSAVAPVAPSAGSGVAPGPRTPAPVVKEIIVRGEAPAVAAGRPDIVAFTSGGAGLPGDRRGLRDVYLRLGSRVSRLSRPLRGFDAGHADQPAISADGTRVAYRMAMGRKGGDAELAPRIVLHDRRSGRTRPLVAAPYLDQQQPAISPDGRVVAFVARRQPGEALQVFAVDVVDGTTALASRNGAAAGDGPSTRPTVSHKGQVIAFSSEATNLAGDGPDPNGVADVYVVRQALAPGAGPPARISDPGPGQPGDGPSRAPSISDDGRVVAFESFATNLVAGDTNATMDVFVRDLATGVVTMVSASPERTAGDGPSREPAVSGDGRYVAFTSRAANLLPALAPRRRPGPPVVDARGRVARTPADRVYARDLVQARTVRASPASGASASAAGEPAISADGRFVSFSGGSRLRVVRHRDLLATTTGPAMLRFDTDDLLRTVVVTNSGFGPLQPGQARLSGPGAEDYWVASNTCQGISVAPGRSCFVVVGLNQDQGAIGARHAALQIEGDRSLPGFDQVELLSGSLVTRAVVCDGCTPPSFADEPFAPPFNPCAPVFPTIPTTIPVPPTTIPVPPTTTTTNNTFTLSFSNARLAQATPTSIVCPEEPEIPPTTIPVPPTTVPPTTVPPTTVPPTTVPPTTVPPTTVPPTTVPPTTVPPTTVPPTTVPPTTVPPTTVPPTTVPPTTVPPTTVPDTVPPPSPPLPPPPSELPPPRLTVNPPLGEPGKVTMATGTNYPPNTDVRLSWSQGIGTKVVRTDGSGRFRTPVLIFHKDRLGMRVLTGAAASAVATADFQVVPGTLIPGDFLIRR